MSIKELNEIGRKDIPYKVRLKNAIKIRDVKDTVKDLEKEHSIEVFNNYDFLKDADHIGVTMYHPDMINPTHIRTAIFDITISEKEFARQIKRIDKEFQKKIEGK